MDSAAAASGAKKEAPDITLEVLSTAVVTATVKCNHAGEIAGMRRLFSSMGGMNTGMSPLGMQSAQPNQSFDEVFLSRFVRLLQDFVVTAEKNQIDNTVFRETCSQSTALLLDHMVNCLNIFHNTLLLVMIAFANDVTHRCLTLEQI